jgi:predicted nucleic acid-binding protein
MSGKVFVDTNILVYSFDASEPEKCPVARSRLERLWEERNGCLSYQVFGEFYVMVTGKLSPGLDPPEAREIVRSLFAWRPVPIDAAAIERAWRLMDRFSLHFWNALIVAAANLCEAEILFSEDLRAELEIDGTRIVNPFQAEPQRAKEVET